MVWRTSIAHCNPHTVLLSSGKLHCTNVSCGHSELPLRSRCRPRVSRDAPQGHLLPWYRLYALRGRGRAQRHSRLPPCVRRNVPCASIASFSIRESAISDACVTHGVVALCIAVPQEMRKSGSNADLKRRRDRDVLKCANFVYGGPGASSHQVEREFKNTSVSPKYRSTDAN